MKKEVASDEWQVTSQREDCGLSVDSCNEAARYIAALPRLSVYSYKDAAPIRLGGVPTAIPIPIC
jgi:hypothetical protein